MLSHTNIKTTQLYARITNKKIEQGMEVLASKMSSAATHPAASTISQGKTTKACRQALEIPAFRAAAGF